jgi:methylthioribose-1-phosphate isomerase
MHVLKPIVYSNESGRNPSLQVIDQSLITKENTVVYIPIVNVQSAWNAIRRGQICGEPWSAIVATISVALDLICYNYTYMEEDLPSFSESILRLIDQKVDYLRTSRPTDVNLFHSLDRLMEACHKVVAEYNRTATTINYTATTYNSIHTSCKDMLVKAILSFGETLMWSVGVVYQAIGAYGANAIRTSVTEQKQQGRELHLLTIGITAKGLGLGYYGGAAGSLAVVRSLMEQNYLHSITVLDSNTTSVTNPAEALEYMAAENDSAINVTYITNPMSVATYIQQHPVHAILVGAHRVCANTGYAFATVGTYQLACLAQGHSIPFYVAAPSTSFTSAKLLLCDEIDTVVSAKTNPPITKEDPYLPPVVHGSVNLWSPKTLDVTPASLITAIVTEYGVIHKEENNDSTFPITKFIRDHGGEVTSSISSFFPEATTVKCETMSNYVNTYKPFTVHSILSYLETNCPQVMEELGTTASFHLSAKEIGDGKYNIVFIVTNELNPNKSVIVKQVRK